ncbi:MAG TPA: GNAT family protein [Solirubrobacteraceae bacterium]|jgi:ribosomal-protein-serine acetyltransferase|nr:GNAT family protein [Solirubrobacteraceae bacterium]
MLTHMLDERRWLRLLEESDAEELYAVVDANRAYLAQWMPWAEKDDLEKVRDFIRSSRQIADNGEFSLAIVDDDRIVGTVGFHRVDRANRSTSIGYWIAEGAQGRGTVTLAVSALLDYAFGAWNLNRIEIRAGAGNARSRAIPERLGFTQEGVRRQAERVGDRWVDHAVYAILASEWAQRSDRSSTP